MLNSPQNPFSDNYTNDYPIIYPVVKWLNHFSYGLSIWLTVTLVFERYWTFVKGLLEYNKQTGLNRRGETTTSYIILKQHAQKD